MEDKLQASIANDILEILRKEQLSTSTIQERLKALNYERINDEDLNHILTVLIKKCLVIKTENSSLILTNDGKNFTIKNLKITLADWRYKTPE